MGRPAFIRHLSELESADSSHYTGDAELMSIGAPLGKLLGLKRIGIHHQRVPAGRGTSYPHAESAEEEFVFVLEGNPDAWIDGHLQRLRPGDAIAFPAGTGICHTFINDTGNEVRLLVVGETSNADNPYLLSSERGARGDAARSLEGLAGRRALDMQHVWMLTSYGRLQQ